MPLLADLAARLRRIRTDGAPARPRPLSDEQLQHWHDHGFLVLPGLFGPDRLAELTDEIDLVWSRRAEDDRGLVVDVFIDTPDERRVRLADAPDEAKDRPYKLNDLFLVSDLVRETILHRQLVDVADQLLDGAPLVCNSLTFERGSQQGFHFDTFYMPPLVPNKMLATWIALEDAHEDAGPLRYWPGSHRIPPYHFSHGRLNAVPEEMPAFYEHIEPLLAERGLSWTTFPAKAGDVFIWHAQLYHGGAPIEDMSRTRKSLVTHYLRAQDMDPASVVDVGGGRYYMRREHQAVPGEDE